MTVPNIIALNRAVLCESCFTVNDSTGETCVCCKAVGTLLPLARVLNPTPELGAVTFILAEATA